MHPALKKHFEGKIELTAEQEDLIGGCFKPMTAKRNEILVQKGNVARHVYFVIKGCLRVFLIGEDGSERTRFLIFEGRMGTAFPSFILREPSVAFLQSLEPSELLALSYEDRQMLLREIPAFERFHRIGIELEYIAAIQRIETLITMDAKSRYQLLLETHPEITRRLPAKIVADYLGISQETLSRLKAKK
jgi:CRP-like cAMP-binding protein